MIVEIQGVDEEKMKKIEKILRSLHCEEAEEFKNKTVVSVDSGRARRIKTHRLVFRTYPVLYFLREPGELCLTLEGSPNVICNALGPKGILSPVFSFPPESLISIRILCKKDLEDE